MIILPASIPELHGKFIRTFQTFAINLNFEELAVLNKNAVLTFIDIYYYFNIVL